ncbi:MAG TPA: polysaccharide pyruvyl transferase family protein [Longimicrobium sp.]|nr:polysaccharide pyruvyl transferase family protein [Longimicrobium sp.]
MLTKEKGTEAAAAAPGASPAGAPRGPRVLMLHGINLFNAGDHGIALAIIERIREVLPGAGLRVASPFLDAQRTRREYHDAVRADSPVEYPPEVPDLYQLPVGGRATRRQLLGAAAALLTFVLVWLLPRALSRRVAPGRRFIREVEEAELVISKGGGFLLDRGTSSPIPIHLIPIGIAVRLRRPVVIYAQTVGPFDRRLSRWLAGVILRRTALLLVRDQYSVDYAVDVLRVPAEKVHLTGDEAFRLASVLERTPPAPEVARAPGTYRAGITLVAPRYGGFPGEAPDAAYLRAVAATVDRLCAPRDGAGAAGEVVMIPHLESGSASDRILAGRVREAARASDLVSILPAANPLATIRAMQRLDVMVCTRMHSVIFAIVAGVPFVAISYLPKTDSLLAQLGLDGWSVPLRDLLDDPDGAAERVARMAQALVAEGPAARERVARARGRAFQASARNGEAVAALAAARTAVRGGA